MPTVLVLNIKASMPTVDEARRRLILELDRAKKQGYKAIVAAPGAKSRGTNGEVVLSLDSLPRFPAAPLPRSGVIRPFVAGERWDSFEGVARAILDACPELSRDSDLGQGNEGVTIILL